MQFRRLTPELVTDDIVKTIAFYTGTLGFRLDATFPPDANPPRWVQFACAGDYLMFEARSSLGAVIPELLPMCPGGSFDVFIYWRASKSTTNG